MLKMRVAGFVLALAGVLPIAVSWAGEEPAVLDPVVVTGSREVEQASAVPAQVTVVSAADIENTTAGNVPELLGSLPGIHVSDVTGNKRNYRVDLRGFGEAAQANHLVLVDGRRVNQPDLSGVDWTLIPLERIERIEIIRGSRGSVLYGDNATGGVINIITREGVRNEADAAVQYGSYDTFKGAASGSAVGERWSVGISGSYLDTDGYRDNSDSQAGDAGLNLRYDPAERLSLTLTSGWHKDDTRLPGALKASDFAAGADRTDTVNPDDFADTEDYYLTGGLQAGFLSDDRFSLEGSWRRRSTDQFASFSEGEFNSDTQIDTLIASPKFTFQQDFGGVANRLLFGIDFTQAEEDITNRALFFGTPSSGRFTLEKQDVGYYVHDELSVGSGVSLSGGYRYDRAEFSFKADGSAQPDTTLDEQVYNAAINYAYAGSSHLYLSYARGFRYPLLDELFNFFTSTIDSSLRPQTSDNYEIGISHNLAAGLTASANLFHIESEDEIFYNPDAFSNQNLDGEAVRQGVGLAVRLRHAGVELGAGYTYTDTDIDGGQFDGRELPDVPEHQASADASYRFGFGLRVGLDAHYVGERLYISDFANTFAEQDAYTVVNARMSYDWRRLTLFANFNNIFSEEYAEYGVLGGFPVETAQYPSPEFNVMAGVSARFGGL